MQKKLVSAGLTLLSLCLLNGCATQSASEKAVAASAQAQGLSATDSRFDGTFVAPEVNFGRYSAIQLEPLDVDNIEVRRAGGELRNTPWKLSDDDKAQYRSRYLEAVTRYLIADGRFESTVEPSANSLLLRARIVQIAPLGSKDDFAGRPGGETVFTEGMGTMTIELTLFDSASGKVLAVITDRRELGQLWEENNRVTNSVHVRNAFNAWIKNLRLEIERLSSSQ